MKKVYLLIAAAFLVVGLFAQSERQTLVIKQGVDIKMDGWADEDVWEKIEAVPVARQVKDDPEASLGSSFFKMFYTDEFLYTHVYCDDDEHLPAWKVEGATEHWMYDKTEIYFDVNDVLQDGVGGQGVNPTNGHYQFADPYADDNYDVLQVSEDNPGYEFIYSLDGEVLTMEYRTTISTLKNEDGVEMTIAALKALPEGMGFDVCIIDRDTGDDDRKRFVWSHDGTGTSKEAYNSMDDCGVVTFSDDKLVGFNEYKLPTLSVFPNPVQDFMTIDGKFNKVVISNIIGQQVKAIDTNSKKIDVSDLSKGLYVVKAFDNGVYKGTAKFTKN